MSSSADKRGSPAAAAGAAAPPPAEADADASPFVRLVCSKMTSALLAAPPGKQLDSAAVAGDALATADEAVARGALAASRRMSSRNAKSLEVVLATVAEATAQLQGGLAQALGSSFTRITRFYAAALCAALPLRSVAAPAAADKARGICAACGGEYNVTTAGKIRHHKSKAHGDVCEGVELAPSHLV